jgi:type II secretory pathway pseudopilin PulG
MRRRSGIMYVEVLLGILIIAIVGGLVLTAIGRVRDSAARSTCANNLKQIVLAVHNYNDAFQGKLPPLTDQGEDTPTGTGRPSLFFNLIPYVEADAGLYAAYDRNEAWTYNSHTSVFVPGGRPKNSSLRASLNGGVANQDFPVLQDPADESNGPGLGNVKITLPDGSLGFYATGSYAANGMIPWNATGFPKNIGDGTPYTIMFGEKPHVCKTANQETIFNLWGLGIYSPHMPAFATLTPTEPAGLISSGQIAPVVPLVTRENANQILVRIGREDATPQSPDFPTPVQLLRGSGSCDARLPASPHFGVMQSAMADGSVHIFTRTASPWVFWAACTPNGGEYLKMDW